MNKKILALLIVAVLIYVTCLTSMAAIGDRCGSIYATDIKAYINGVQVKAYNIGGRTCVAIEEVTSGYAYRDEHRVLLVGSFAPDVLNEYTGESRQGKIGDVIGTIYATDIKTYFYDKEVPSYNIGGKTCVAIEDIGRDNTFSEIGGKYIWDPIKRTISLEYLYENYGDVSDLLREYKYSAFINDGKIELKPALTEQSMSWNMARLFPPQGNAEGPVPIYYEADGEMRVIGFYLGGYRYYYAMRSDESGNDKYYLGKGSKDISCYYLDNVKEMLNQIGVYRFTREEVVAAVLEAYLPYAEADVVERYDTETFTYVMYIQPTPKGTFAHLLCVHDAGDDVDYIEIIGHQYSHIIPSSVVLDREKNTVTFTMAGGVNQFSGESFGEITYTFDLITWEFIE